MIAASQHDYASTERWWKALRDSQRPGTPAHEQALFGLGNVAEVQGQLARSAQYIRDAEPDAEARGLPTDLLEVALGLAWMDLRYRNRPADGIAKVTAALARHPLAGIDPESRPYTDLARFYAHAGRLAEAQRLMAEFERVVPAGVRKADVNLSWTVAEIALQQGRYRDAIRVMDARRRETGCGVCALFEIAGAYEKLGQADSALATYEDLVTRPAPYRINSDAYTLAPTYKRLGELYEAKGDRVRARDYYGRFADLWKNADAELQPVVQDVRARIVRLSAER
jgi:tetratricopeptide (TPR) repeat protein